MSKVKKESYIPVPTQNTYIDQITDQDQRLKVIESKQKDLEENQRNIQVNFVEILGLFTAALALIFSSTQLPFNQLSVTAILSIFLLLGAILVIFVISIDIVVKNNSNKIWFIAGALIVIAAVFVAAHYKWIV